MSIQLTVKAWCMSFAVFAVALGAQAQTIKLNNASFEDLPMHSTTPYGWSNCGDPIESPPDIQPGQFEVTLPAQNGRTYLGLVVRDNNTWEGVSQRLSSPMKGGECYDFSVSLAKAARYVSLSKSTKEKANFNEPARLKIWGGNGNCSRMELLAVTKPVDNTSWETYSVKLKPSRTYSYLFLEAIYKEGTVFPYNGNLLIDNCSELVPCDKPQAPIVADISVRVLDKKSGKPLNNASVTLINTRSSAVDSKRGNQSTFKWSDVEKDVSYRIKVQRDGYEDASKVISTKNLTASRTINVSIALDPKPEPIAVVTDDPKVDTPTKKPEKVVQVKDFDRSKIAVGTLLRTEEIQFKADKYELLPSSFGVLNDLYELLRINSDIKIEVGGHTNNIPSEDYCDWLSEQRAKAVADYLVKRGIKADRITFKGYGKRNPITTNETAAGRRRNQRVDIKILEFSS